MYSFLISIAALVVGYLLYGAFVERVFGPDPKRPEFSLQSTERNPWEY